MPRRLPWLVMYDASNVMRIQHLYRFLSVFQRKLFNRSIVYSTGILMLYLVQTAYLALLVIFSKKPLDEQELCALTGLINTSVFILLFY